MAFDNKDRQIIRQVGNTLVRVTFGVRAANTTAYAANKAIALDCFDADIVNLIGSGVACPVWNVVEKAGDGGYITQVILETSQVTNTSAYQLFFYSSGSFSIADNATLLHQTVLSGLPTLIGVVDIPALVPGTSVAWGINATAIRLPFITLTTPHLSVCMKTVTGFTPDSVQGYKISVGIERG